MNIKSPYRVGKYKVNIKDLEEIGVNAISDYNPPLAGSHSLREQVPVLKENKIIIIDEIGKMEMFSEKFKKAVEATLNSKNKVLGTIKLTSDSFTDKIKKREDTKIFHLISENREEIKREIIKLLKSK